MKKLIIPILLCLCGIVHAQRTVSGSVTDQDGQPLIGASVTLKTGDGTITGNDGSFSLMVPSGNQQLKVSFIGYETSEITLAEHENDLRITLRVGVTLEAVIVTALGITRSEKSLGYAVSQVGGEDISKVRDPNIVNQLAGRAAGVTVIGSTGNLGSSSRITIRGIKSINGDNQPLFVVDGIPMDNSNFTDRWQAIGAGTYDYGNAIQDVNPDDVDQVSILKGQAAAALYGSRGANGVIIITTKKGKSSPSGAGGRGLGVSVNSSLTFDQVSVFPKSQKKYGGGVDLLPRGYADDSGFYDVPFSDGSTTYASFDLVPIYGVDESNGIRFATSSDQHFQHLMDEWGYEFPNGFGTAQSNLHYRNWNSWDAWDTEHFGQSILWEAGDDPIEFFETGVTSSQNIAIEGGGDRTSFRLSYNRFDQKGIYPNSKMERNSIGFNGSLDLNDHFNAFLGVNYVNSNTRGRSGSGYDNRGGINPAFNLSQWWHTQLRFDDLKSYENPDGTMRTWNRLSADNPRPLYWDNPYWAREKNYQTDGRNRVFGNIGVTWKINSWLNVTGRVLTDFYNEFREDRIAEGSLLTSLYALDLYRVNETNADLIARAEKNLGNVSISAFVGGNKRWSTVNRDYGSTVGGLSVPGIYRIQNSRERPIVSNTLTEKQIESLLGGISLGWRNLLYLDLTGRQDWSSSLPDDDNGYFYPSASTSFVFSELVKIPTLSFGKLRLGWARVGNDTDPYNIYAFYLPNQNFGSEPSVTVPNTLNNPRLKPEKTSTIEGGVDLRFFSNRLGLDLTLYSGKTTDQIIPLATTPTSGYSNQFINAGEITNKGIEISLHLAPVQTRDITWELDFNFGKNKNEVVSILPEDPSIVSLPLAFAIFGGASLNAYIGQPYGTILGTNYLFDKDGNKLVDPNSGFYLFSAAQMPIGNVVPDFTGGVTNTFSWKGLSLGVFIDFRKGGDIISTTNMWGRYSGLFEETAKGDVRENGVLNKGVLAVTDGDGLPVQDGGQDTGSLLDDTFQSNGKANDMKVNYQAHNFFDGGYVINAADVYDGSFIKLREVSLGYALPKKWLQNAGIQDINISMVGRNLAYFLKNVPNIDPDHAISTGNIQGLEGATTPSTRSFGVNLNLRF